MIYQTYCIHDNGTNSFNVPLYFQTALQARRAFNMEINHNDPKNTMYQVPGDFDLYHVGTYDTDTGMHHPISPKLELTGTETADRK